MTIKDYYEQEKTHQNVLDALRKEVTKAMEVTVNVKDKESIDEMVAALRMAANKMEATQASWWNILVQSQAPVPHYDEKDEEDSDNEELEQYTPEAPQPQPAQADIIQLVLQGISSLAGAYGIYKASRR